ncbi:MAG: hypothetical protein ABL918_10725 [Chakrabartia sp.]
MSLILFFAAATAIPTPKCSAENAKPVSFRYVEANAGEAPGKCIRITGYLLDTSLHLSKAVALSKEDPDWRTIGLDGDIKISKVIKRVTVYGRVEDCGHSMKPSYCHYVGGSVIRDARFK